MFHTKLTAMFFHIKRSIARYWNWQKSPNISYVLINFTNKKTGGWYLKPNMMFKREQNGSCDHAYYFAITNTRQILIKTFLKMKLVENTQCDSSTLVTSAMTNLKRLGTSATIKKLEIQTILLKPKSRSNINVSLWFRYASLVRT